MAILLRNKTTVYGLTTDLALLQTNIDAEVTRATGVEGALVSLTTVAKTNLVAAINELDTDLAAEATRAAAAELVLTNDLASEVTRATAAEGVLTTNLAAEVTRATGVEGALASLTTTEKTTLVAAINELVTADASINTRIDNVLSNMDGVALNSLAEIVTAFQDADSDLNGAITALSAAAGTGLDDEIARAEAAELVLTTNLAAEVTRATAAEGVLTTNLAAEVTRATAAEATLTTNLAAEVTRATAAEVAEVAARKAQAAIPVLEMLTVAANKVVCSFAPQAGVNGVMNFATVRYIDGSGLAYDAPVTLDGADTSGKTFIVSVDTSGQWDGFSVAIQYVRADIS